MDKFFLINKYCRFLNDTGSVEIQIILITFKINNIIKHLKINNKDFSCKRSFIKLLNNRFKLLKYLKRKNEFLYCNLIKDLNLKNNINIDVVKR